MTLTLRFLDDCCWVLFFIARLSCYLIFIALFSIFLPLAFTRYGWNIEYIVTNANSIVSVNYYLVRREKKWWNVSTVVASGRNVLLQYHFIHFIFFFRPWWCFAQEPEDINKNESRWSHERRGMKKKLAHR